MIAARSTKSYFSYISCSHHIKSKIRILLEWRAQNSKFGYSKIQDAKQNGCFILIINIYTFGNTFKYYRLAKIMDIQWIPLKTKWACPPRIYPCHTAVFLRSLYYQFHISRVWTTCFCHSLAPALHGAASSIFRAGFREACIRLVGHESSWRRMSHKCLDCPRASTPAIS